MYSNENNDHLSSKNFNQIKEKDLEEEKTPYLISLLFLISMDTTTTGFGIGTIRFIRKIFFKIIFNLWSNNNRLNIENSCKTLHIISFLHDQLNHILFI